MLVTHPKKAEVTFRVIDAADRDFLYRAYASTRAEEMAVTGWGAAEQDSFLRSQFDLQSKSYEMNFIGAVHRIIQLDGTDIGRLIINRADDHLRLIDITILPAWRGRGIGTDILRSLMNEALGGKVPMRLFADTHGRAQRLYLRHGFRPLRVVGYYTEYEWSGQGAGQGNGQG